MPKNEFDFEDPLELNGVALRTQEDTTDLMCECFIEEFMRLRYAPGQILALFRNPHYLGMRLVLQNRGEEFVRDRIAEVFSRWGRQVDWTPTAPAASTTVRNVPDKDSPISHPRPNPVTAHAATGLERGIKGEGRCPADSITVRKVPDKDSPISYPRPNPAITHEVTGLGRGIKGEGQ